MADTDQSRAQQDAKGWIARLRQANGKLRAGDDTNGLSASEMDVLLLIAENPGQPLSWIEQASGRSTSGIQRVLKGLGVTDRFGNPGVELIEEITDPGRSNRKLYFVTKKGRTRVVDALTVLMGHCPENSVSATATEYIEGLKAERSQQQPRVITNSFPAYLVANAKRSLRQKGVSVGKHTIAFPLLPAERILDEIEAWLNDKGGKLHRMPNLARPEGMALADLPDRHEQFHFMLRFRGTNPMREKD